MKRTPSEGQNACEPKELVAALPMCIADLSATSWKIVSRVGYLNIDHYWEHWRSDNDQFSMMGRDTATMMNEQCSSMNFSMSTRRKRVTSRMHGSGGCLRVAWS